MLKENVHEIDTITDITNRIIGAMSRFKAN